MVKKVQADTSRADRSYKAHPHLKIAPAVGSSTYGARVVSVTSGKGGVGKTNLVANLAIAFTSLGKRVLVLDADLGLSNIDVLLGITTKYNIKNLLDGDKKIAEILVDGPCGFKIIAACSGIEEMTRLSPESKMALLGELDSFEGDFDILLIDTGAGISSNVTYFNVAANEVLLVVTPEPTSLTDAYAMMKVLSSKYSKRYFKLAVNCVRNRKEAETIYDKLLSVGGKFLNVAIDYLGSIPYDEKLQIAVKGQKAVLEQFPNSEVSKAVIELAKNLLNSDPNPKGSSEGCFWKKLLSAG